MNNSAYSIQRSGSKPGIVSRIEWSRQRRRGSSPRVSKGVGAPSLTAPTPAELLGWGPRVGLLPSKGCSESTAPSLRIFSASRRVRCLSFRSTRPPGRAVDYRAGHSRHRPWRPRDRAGVHRHSYSLAARRLRRAYGGQLHSAGRHNSDGRAGRQRAEGALPVTTKEIERVIGATCYNQIAMAVSIEITCGEPIGCVWDRKDFRFGVKRLLDKSALRFVRLSIRTIGIDGISIPTMQRE